MKFKLIEFKQIRHIRGADAARVECIDDGEKNGNWLWMSVKDLKANIREFGAHHDLIKALNHYGVRYKPAESEIAKYKEHLSRPIGFDQFEDAMQADLMIEDMPITKTGILVPGGVS